MASKFGGDAQQALWQSPEASAPPALAAGKRDEVCATRISEFSVPDVGVQSDMKIETFPEVLADTAP